MAAFSSRGSLHLANTYIEQDYLKVLGKGDKERIVPFGINDREGTAALHPHLPARADSRGY